MNNIFQNSIVNLPTPSSINTIWNIGFLLGIILSSQIASGLILSMSYSPEITNAFIDVSSIINETEIGFITRILHTNTASLFFLVIYWHTARGLYFSSPANQQNTWMSGIILIILTIATAFLGYVLPWGQISFWGATVITGTISAIPIVGTNIVTWIWGGASVAQPTLNRFFSLHFVTPMLIIVVLIIHLISLHENGSSNPISTLTNYDNINFFPLILTNDFQPLIIASSVIVILILINPIISIDTENFNQANPLIAPLHIQPEWYFLFAYAILRSIPSNLGGVLALVASILILALNINNNNKTTNFNTSNKANFWIFTSAVVILTWIGANPVESPFEDIGNVYTIAYFSLILIL